MLSVRVVWKIYSNSARLYGRSSNCWIAITPFRHRTFVDISYYITIKKSGGKFYQNFIALYNDIVSKFNDKVKLCINLARYLSLQIKRRSRLSFRHKCPAFCRYRECKLRFVRLWTWSFADLPANFRFPEYIPRRIILWHTQLNPLVGSPAGCKWYLWFSTTLIPRVWFAANKIDRLTFLPVFV